MTRKQLFATGMAIFAVTACAQASLMITEVMYDPFGSNEHEYVELFNSGDMTIDLTGYTLSDNPEQTLPNLFTLTGGTIAPGETAVLIRIDSARTLENFQNAWGGLNFIEVPSWPIYTNGGDTVVLYDPADSIVASVNYSVTNDFPTPNNASSIYMLDPSAADPYAGSNWGLSQDGIDGAHYGNAPRAGDIGSPGAVVPEPASLALLVIGAMVCTCRRR